MPNTPQELVTTAQVADQLGCDVSTVHRLVNNGRLKPCAKAPGIRGAYLFAAGDIENVQRDRGLAA